MKRFRDFIRMIISWFFDIAEESVPLERRLAYDRQERATAIKKMMDSATDVGQVAELMVQDLAEARIVAANLREETKGHLQAAKAAASRSDQITEETERASAIALSNDLAEAETDLREMEADASEALSDKKEALQMVLLQARELEGLAHSDARRVSKVRLIQMKDQRLQLRETMLQLVPGDREDIRGRVMVKVKQREARVKSRADIVNALWEQKRRGVIAQASQVTARGNQILQQLQEEMGYQKVIVEDSAEVGETKKLGAV